MPVTANKGTPLCMPEGQAEPEINVVTYDEEQLEPVEAVPVTLVEDVTAQLEQQSSPFVPPYAAPTTTTSPTTAQTNTNQQQQQQLYQTDRGCECVLAGDTRLKHLSPGFHIFASLCGDTYIDIHDASFPTGSKVRLLNLRLCGSTNMCVPPGTRVVVRRLMLCGNRDIFVEDSANPEAAPRITLTEFSLCGDVRVRSDPKAMTNKFERLMEEWLS